MSEIAVNVLVTGFEPFGLDHINPSWEVARALDGWQQSGATVHAVQLPCVFDRALACLDVALTQYRPELVVCLGLAGGRSEVSVERVAINMNDARIPDNAGQQPVDTAVVAQAPAAFFATLPIKAIVHELRAQGFAAGVSNTAGTFVCNHVFYGLMHRLAAQGGAVRGGFVHLPYLPEQAAQHAGAPSMALETQVRALRALIPIALTVRNDVRETAGHLH